MSPDTPSCILIKGLTSSGKAFRPSDWAERLAGVFTCLGDDHRLRYSPHVRPVSVENVRCVEVSSRLREVDPMAFNFLMNFARDNELQVVRQEACSPGQD
jgi:hypothetical protein